MSIGMIKTDQLRKTILPFLGVIILAILPIASPVVHADSFNTLSGTFLDAHGQPVAHASLAFSSRNGNYGSTQTQDDGTYSVQLIPDIYYLNIIANGATEPQNISLQNSDTGIDLRQGDQTQNLQLSGARVTVIVKDGNGVVQPNMQTLLRSTGDGSTSLYSDKPSAQFIGVGAGSVQSVGTTDTSGQVDLTAPIGLVYQACAVTPSNMMICNPTVFTLTGDMTIEVDVPVLHTLSGTFLDARNQPVAHASLAFSSQNGNYGSTQTQDNGTYSVQLVPDIYYLNIIANGATEPQNISLQNSDTGIDLRQGDQTQNLQLSGARVTVIVKDGNGVVQPNMQTLLRSTGDGSTSLYSDKPSAQFIGVGAGSVQSVGTTDTSGQVDLTAPIGLVYQACAVTPSGMMICNPTAFTLIGDMTTEVDLGSAPTITSPNSVSTMMRKPLNFVITTTGSPSPSITESGVLPTGITFTDNGDGTAILSGEAAAGTSGTYPITLTATNSSNVTHQSFTITVTTTASPPVITSSNSDTETFGVPFSYTVTTDGYPVPAITKTGTLPSGVTFTDNKDGTATIGGTPSSSALGNYTITLKAKSSAGTSSQSFTLTITKAPVIAKIANRSAFVGTAFSMTITAKGYQTPALNENGALPSGLSFVDKGNGTAIIAGTPTSNTGGIYSITVTATNQLGSSTQTFVLTVNQTPEFTSGSTATAVTGTAFTFQITASGYPKPTFSKTGTLPSGLVFHNNTGIISGTPRAGTTGTYSITITAKNSKGSVTQNFVLTVQQG